MSTYRSERYVILSATFSWRFHDDATSPTLQIALLCKQAIKLSSETRDAIQIRPRNKKIPQHFSSSMKMSWKRPE